MTTSTFASVLCIGRDAVFLAVAAEAAHRVKTRTGAMTVSSLAEAGAVAGSGQQKPILLALCDPDAELLRQAVDAVDDDALPRWPVVVFGRGGEIAPDVPVVPREDWNAALVAHVFRGAVRAHELRRAWARCRGDIATYGSRIAHDLRTPLGGMLTTAEMLREILEEQQPACATHTQPILESAESMAKLIERISFLAKATVSQEPPQRCDMGTSFWNAFQGIESRLLKSGVTLEQPPRWPTVVAHPAWLEVVWRNLLLNAIDHSGAQGRVEAGWSEDGADTCFWLRNTSGTGAGQQPIFFPFHRLHEPGAVRGLGLAIVRRLVEQEGGRCGADVTADGTRCFFTLPTASDLTPVPRAPDSAAS